jgi:hypothetical protein
MIILIIPMFLSIGVYFYSYEIITRTTGEIYAAFLEQACTELDSMVNTVFQALDNLSFNTNVQKLTFVRDKPTPDDHWAIVQLVRDLRIYPVLDLLDDIFVVLNNTGTIVSPIGYIEKELYYSLFYKDEDHDFEGFKEHMRNSYHRPIAYPAGGLYLVL